MNKMPKIVTAMILSGIIAASLTACGLLREAAETETVTVTDTKAETETEKPTESETTEPSPNCKPDTTLDLSGMENVDVNYLCEIMETYPNLEVLSTGETVISAEDYVQLCKMNEKVDVISKLDFEGTVLDLSASEVDISGKTVADKALFEDVLSVIPGGMKMVMCDCGYTNEEMGALREKYTGTDFVWRLYLSKWNLRTDDEAFSVMIYAADTYVPLTSEDIEVLKYCTNLYALDLGHQDITDLTPIGEITTLRVLILADNEITDVTPLGNLKELQYLELFVNRITDLTPLAQCTNLVDLNFGWNRVYDISSIYSLPNIERLWLPTNNVPYSARESITAAFPNAQIVFEDKDSVSSGWRTHERYFSMRGMFNNNKYDENFVK
ncbi:MAG: leucine-rich repeat domain-containing protein [Clostridia bacterium]|nr:leucine-rich repeat domain-containing protein [Clostridia bacterium]